MASETNELELSDLSFDQLEIKENILRGIYAYGFEKPSMIQHKAIPRVTAGVDIIAQSQSGTGKTGAFSIGSMNRVDEDLKETQVMILSPTRELAEQTTNVIKEITSYTKITHCKVVGGTHVGEGQRELQKIPHVVVGTPGRILDMLSKKYIFTQHIKTIVIDEADHQGPLAGIARGLEAMEADFAFVIATDMPFVSRQFVDILLSREIPVAMELGGIVQTLAAVYPKEGATVARSLLRSGRARPYDLLKKMGAEIVKETDLTFNPGLDGMNTPEDYLEAISKDDPDAKATVEFFGRIRLLTGMRLQTLPISTLGKLLELAAPDIRWIENDILGREFLISLNGGEFVRNVHMPVGPEESVIVLDAPAGG